MATFAHLIQSASSLPTDASALQSAISALERDIRTLESSSVPWERTLPWFTAVVAFGVVMELWVIWRERRDEMQAWGRGIVRPPDRPSIKKFIVEIVSVLLITGGIVGELWAGVRITNINGSLRSKGAELRSKSDQLVALLNVEAGNAQQVAGKANERAGGLEKGAAQLRKEAEDERMARFELEASVAWRRLTNGQQSEIKANIWLFAGEHAGLWYDAGNAEAVLFATDIEKALLAARWEAAPPRFFMGGPIAGGPLPTGVTISATSDKRSRNASEALQKVLCSLGFDAILEKNAIKNPSPQVSISVNPRPQGPQGEAKLRAEAKKRQKENTQTAKR